MPPQGLSHISCVDAKSWGERGWSYFSGFFLSLFFFFLPHAVDSAENDMEEEEEDFAVFHQVRRCLLDFKNELGGQRMGLPLNLLLEENHLVGKTHRDY